MGFEDDSKGAYDNGKCCSRESGIKFVETKKRKRICRRVLTVVMVICSAFAGGIVGGEYVRKAISAQPASGDQQGLSADISSDSIRQTMKASGSAVVGILGKNPDDGSSGIIFDSEGYIMTSYEAVTGLPLIMVVLPDKPQEPIEAKLVGADLKTNLAVIKIDVQNLTGAVLENEVKPCVGDMVLSIGNPTGVEYAGAISISYISSVNRQIDIDDETYSIIEDSSLTTAGSRGGALCSLDGRVLGMKFVDAEGSKGYSIRADQIKQAAEAIIAGNEKNSPYLGIEHVFLNEDKAKAYGKVQGAWISRVRSNSSGEKAGLKKGDIIMAANGEKIADSTMLARIISSCSVGGSIRLSVWRNGTIIDVTTEVKSSVI